MKKQILLFLLLVLIIPIYTNSQTTQVVSSFSWESKVNDPEDQLIRSGPCNVFAAVSAAEVLYRIYFNRNLLLDSNPVKFSRQYLYSSCSPGYATQVTDVLNTLKDYGIYRDGLYTYNWRVSPHIEEPGATYGHPANCSNPAGTSVLPATTEYMRIPAWAELTFNVSGSGTFNIKSEDDLKRIILKYGPLMVSMQHANLHNGMRHTFLVIGWIWENNRTKWRVFDSWPRLLPNGSTDPLFIGTKYYLKAGYSGSDVRNVDLFTELKTNSASKCYIILYRSGGDTISSVKGNVSQTINCPTVDNDHDGYYYWGVDDIQPSGLPAGCLGKDDELDNNPLVKGRDINGNPQPIPVPLYHISLFETSGLTQLCVGTTYTFKATTGEAMVPNPVYEWTLPSGVSTTTNNSVAYCTPASFVSFQVKVRIKYGSVGWSDYRIVTFTAKPVIDYNNITISPTGSLCPNTYYTFTASVSGALEYRWDLRGDITKISQTNNSVTVKTNSNFSYAQLGAAARNCGGWSGNKYVQYFRGSCLKSTKNTLQPEESNESRSLVIYPNPASNIGSFKICVENADIVEQWKLSLFDIAGSEVSIEIEREGNNFLIKANSLKPGAYIVKATYGTILLSETLIVN